MEDKKKMMEKEAFRELARDLESLIVQMSEVLSRHDINDLAALTVDAGGYFRFQIHNGDWEFKRTDKDSKSRISITICEEL